MVEEFIKLAKGDLDVSLLAYESGNYSNTVFLIQQANEKILKSILILSDTADYESLKKTSHDAVKPMTHFIRKSHLEGMKNIEILSKNLGLDENTLLGTKTMDRLKSFGDSITQMESFKSIDWARAEEEVILELLSSLEESIKVQPQFHLNEEMVAQIQKTFDVEFPLIKFIPENQKKLLTAIKDPQKIKHITDIINGMIKITLGIARPHKISSIMNLILYPHFSDSRYPTTNRGQHNTYDDSHPIIKSYIRIYELTKSSLEETDSFLKNSSSIGKEIAASMSSLFK